MVDPVQIPFSTPGAQRSKRDIDQVSRSLDKVDREAAQATRAMRSFNRESAKAARRVPAAPAVDPAQRRQRTLQSIGRVGGNLGSRFGQIGEVSTFGTGLAALGIGMVALGGVVQTVNAALRRQAESAGEVVRRQQQLAQAQQAALKGRNQGIAADFLGAGGTQLRRLNLLAPGQIDRRIEDARRANIRDPRAAAAAAARFGLQSDRQIALDVGSLAERIGVGTASDVIGRLTQAQLNRTVELSGGDPAKAVNRIVAEIASATLGTRVLPSQVQAASRYGPQTRAGATFTAIDRAQATASAQTATLGLRNPGAVEGVIRGTLAETLNPVAAATLELNNATNREIAVLQAKAQAESKFVEVLRDFTSPEGSFGTQLNRAQQTAAAGLTGGGQ